MIQKFRKLPVVIEAVKWNGDAELANSFIGEDFGKDWQYENANSQNLVIPTLEGEMLCKVGDYIIKGVSGEFYPVKPEIFEKTYEPAE
jgi:hypothetical protein